jgi:peptidoglycan endopeptidase LytE
VRKWFIALIMVIALALQVAIPHHSAEAAYSPTSVIKEAKKYIGTPYRFGGVSPSGFDCSGFVYYTHKKAGKILPRNTSGLFSSGRFVSKSNLRAGDLIFFTTYKRGASHVAIYMGNNQFIHSANAGVKIDSFKNTYWAPKFIGAKRM